MTAGILHHLGVDMGPSVRGNRFNHKGYFEDMEFTNFHCSLVETRSMDYLTKGLEQDITLSGGWLDYYEVLIRKREKSKLWGLKDPRLALFIDDFLKLLDSKLKIIKVTRHPEAVINSLKRYHPVWRIPDDIRLSHIVNQWFRLRDKAVAETKRYREGCITIDYEQAVVSPQETVERIADFAGAPVTQAALDFIDPSLDHSRSQTC